MKILSKIMFFALTLSLKNVDYEEGNIRNPILCLIIGRSIL